MKQTPTGSWWILMFLNNATTAHHFNPDPCLIQLLLTFLSLPHLKYHLRIFDYIPVYFDLCQTCSLWRFWFSWNTDFRRGWVGISAAVSSGPFSSVDKLSERELPISCSPVVPAWPNIWISAAGWHQFVRGQHHWHQAWRGGGGGGGDGGGVHGTRAMLDRWWDSSLLLFHWLPSPRWPKAGRK